MHYKVIRDVKYTAELALVLSTGFSLQFYGQWLDSIPNYIMNPDCFLIYAGFNNETIITSAIYELREEYIYLEYLARINNCDYKGCGQELFYQSCDLFDKYFTKYEEIRLQAKDELVPYYQGIGFEVDESQEYLIYRNKIMINKKPLNKKTR